MAQKATADEHGVKPCAACGGPTYELAGSPADTHYHALGKVHTKEWTPNGVNVGTVMKKIEDLIVAREAGRRRLKDDVKVKKDALQPEFATLNAGDKTAINGFLRGCSVPELAAIMAYANGTDTRKAELADTEADKQYHAIARLVGDKWNSVGSVFREVMAMIQQDHDAKVTAGGRRRLDGVKDVIALADGLDADEKAALVEFLEGGRLSVEQLKAIMDYSPADNTDDDCKFRFEHITDIVGDKLWCGPAGGAIKINGPVYDDVMALIRQVHDAKIAEIAIKVTKATAKLGSFYQKAHY